MSDEKTVMDEVNAALGDAITPEPETEIEETSDTEGGSEETGDTEGSGEDSSEETSDTEAESEAEEGEPEEGPNGERERNPDGTWKAKAAEPPKKDHINDPIPENLKKDTSERIRSLIDTAKTVTAERDKFKTDFDYLVNGVQATGTSPQQYGETLSW